MKKKLLLEQNTQLFDRLTAAESEISRLKKELEEKNRAITALKEENARLSDKKETVTAPLKTLEAKVIKQGGITPDTEYGATVIGKTVVAAAECCERLKTRDNAKELINLILGRTEVTKAEILNIVTADTADEEKRRLIDGQFAAAEDYFASVTAQTE